MMLYSAAVVSLLCLFFEAKVSYGVRFPMEGRFVGKRERAALYRRTKLPGDFGSTGIDDHSDLSYTTDMTIGGQPRSVLVDTGSSDLWTVGTVDSGTDTGLSAGITFAIGSISGSIFTGPIEFAGLEIPDQAYINVTGGQPPSGDGMIGLGPFSSSVVRNTMNSAAGDPVLNRIFGLDVTIPNFMSFVLSRLADPMQPFSVELTVSEYIEGLENITSTPQNPVQILPTSEQGSQHWSLLVDSIIGPDGQPITLSTTVPGESKLVAVLDSDFAFPPVPQAVSDAFYGRVQGAQFDENSSFGPAWQIPCEQELNVTFVIGGLSYPIHPLDLSVVQTQSDGSSLCFGTFQPGSVSPNQFDMVLGTPFLRNTYTLINFGNFVDESTDATEEPFIQLLSLTDPATAHQDFVRARLDGPDITSDPQFALLPPDQGQTSSSSGQSDLSRVNLSSAKTKVESAGKKAVHILIIVGAVIGGLVVLGLLFCVASTCGICACLGRASRRGVGFRGRETTQVYQPLHHPAPTSHPPQYGQHGTIEHGVS